MSVTILAAALSLTGCSKDDFGGNNNSTATPLWKGVTKSTITSMSGSWIYAAVGITNTLPYAMAK